jgi:hypothetical protein
MSIRAASKEVDGIRAKQRKNIPKNLPPNEYTKQSRQHCQPLNYSDRLLRHMAPLWGEGISDWTPILEKQTTSTRHNEVHILNTKAIQYYNNYKNMETNTA